MQPETRPHLCDDCSINVKAAGWGDVAALRAERDKLAGEVDTYETECARLNHLVDDLAALSALNARERDSARKAAEDCAAHLADEQALVVELRARLAEVEALVPDDWEPYIEPPERRVVVYVGHAIADAQHQRGKQAAGVRLRAEVEAERDAAQRQLERARSNAKVWRILFEGTRAERDRMRPVVEAAQVRTQVLRDLRQFGSGSEGWSDRDRDSDGATARAVEEYEHPMLVVTVPPEGADDAIAQIRARIMQTSYDLAMVIRGDASWSRLVVPGPEAAGESEDR